MTDPKSKPVRLRPVEEEEAAVREWLETTSYVDPKTGEPFTLSDEELRAGREDGDDF